MIVGDLENAEECLNQALTLCEQMNDKRGLADNLGNLGNIAFERGEWARSAELHQQSLDLYAAVGYRRGQAYELCNVAYLVQERGDLGEAAAFFQEALAICRDAGFRQGEAVALTGLGATAHKQRGDRVAIHYYQRALAIAQAVQLPDLARVLCTNLGFLAELADNPIQAEKWYTAAAATIESGRHDLADENLRILYLARRLDPLSRLVLVSWRQQKGAESFQWCEAGRSRAFLDLLGGRLRFTLYFADAAVDDVALTDVAPGYETILPFEQLRQFLSE
jgi:tetratricopeptide (TPR) repeat protein